MHAIQLQHYTKARFSCFPLDEEILVNAGHVAPRFLGLALDHIELTYHDVSNSYIY